MVRLTSVQHAPGVLSSFLKLCPEGICSCLDLAGSSSTSEPDAANRQGHVASKAHFQFRSVTAFGLTDTVFDDADDFMPHEV